MPLLKGKSPFVILNNTDVDYQVLKVFGCLAYASTLTRQRSKFDPRARPCVFVGYPPGVKGYKLYDVVKKEFFVSRDVVFIENFFPFKAVSCAGIIHDCFDNHVLPHSISEEGAPSYVEPIVTDRFSNPLSIENNSQVEGDLLIEPSTDDQGFDNNNSEPTDVVRYDSLVPECVDLRRSSRSRCPPTYLRDFHCNLLKAEVVVKDSCPYHFSKYMSYDKFALPHREFLLNISMEYEPVFYHQAIPFSHWKEAMDDELKAMERTKTWSVVPLPHGRHTIGNKWVYRIKYKEDGSVDRYKARLVAKGYNQQEGIDFLYTFSLVAKFVTVKALLTLAVTYNWQIVQMDINNAFLNGDLFEEVYMDLPLGYKMSNVAKQGEKLVCRLHKSMYGLKQASRQWFSKFTMALLTHGFHQSKSDYYIFTKGKGDSFVALLVYVDDIILTGSSSIEINSVKEALKSHFMLKDLGSARYFLGLELSRSKQGLSLTHMKYCLQILEDTSFLNCKPVVVHMDPNLKLSKDIGPYLSDEEATTYRRLIGRLLYLQISRSNISFAVHKLSQFPQKPSEDHLNAAHQLLRYLKRAPGRGVLLKPTENFQLRAFVDADWGACLDTRRSVTSFCIFLGESLISWKSKKQPMVSRSSAEVEYRTFAAVTSELFWIDHLLHDLQIKILQPTVVYCDNQAAITIASNPFFHERTKHIEIDCHFVRDKIIEGFIKLLPVRSSLQLADVFTKSIASTSLQIIMDKLRMSNIHSST